MSMQDPIADMITRIRNGQMAQKHQVEIPNSKLKKSIAIVLKEQGYIEDFTEEHNQSKPVLKVILKYFAGKAVIDEITRVSRPGLRIYKKAQNLPKIKGGLGIALISTCKGIMADKQAREESLGGEVLISVS